MTNAEDRRKFRTQKGNMPVLLAGYETFCYECWSRKVDCLTPSLPRTYEVKRRVLKAKQPLCQAHQDTRVKRNAGWRSDTAAAKQAEAPSAVAMGGPEIRAFLVSRLAASY